MKEYDDFISNLKKSIEAAPSMRHRLILKAIKESDCPYLNRRIKALSEYLASDTLSSQDTAKHSLDT